MFAKTTLVKPSIQLHSFKHYTCFNEMNLLVEDLKCHQVDNHFNESHNEVIEIKGECPENVVFGEGVSVKRNHCKRLRVVMHLIDINNKKIRIKIGHR